MGRVGGDPKDWGVPWGFPVKPTKKKGALKKDTPLWSRNGLGSCEGPGYGMSLGLGKRRFSQAKKK